MSRSDLQAVATTSSSPVGTISSSSVPASMLATITALSISAFMAWHCRRAVSARSCCKGVSAPPMPLVSISDALWIAVSGVRSSCEIMAIRSVLA